MNSYKGGGKKGSGGNWMKEKLMIKVAHTRGILHTSKEILTVFGHLALEAKPITYSYPTTMHYIIQFSSCFQNVENIGQRSCPELPSCWATHKNSYNM
jgi:hypothetical protein